MLNLCQQLAFMIGIGMLGWPVFEWYTLQSKTRPQNRVMNSREWEVKKMSETTVCQYHGECRVYKEHMAERSIETFTPSIPTNRQMCLVPGRHVNCLVWQEYQKIETKPPLDFQI